MPILIGLVGVAAIGWLLAAAIRYLARPENAHMGLFRPGDLDGWPVGVEEDELWFDSGRRPLRALPSADGSTRRGT